MWQVFPVTLDFHSLPSTTVYELNWSLSLVARLVYFNLTSKPWLRFSDVFIYIDYCNYELLIEHYKNRIFKRYLIYYHIFVFVILFRTKKIRK